MKLRKLMAALTAAATVLSGLPPAVHLPHVHAEESYTHTHEEEAPSGIYEDTGAPVMLTRIESEPSEYGLTEVTYLDENGNPVEFDLVPEGIDRATELPEKYDLREEGLVTPAKSQSPTDTCWAHGAMAVAESNLIKKGYADTSLDLSEAHLVYFARCYSPLDESDVLYGEGYSDGYLGYQANESAGEKDGYSSGGNPLNIQSAFSHWSGPVVQPSTEKIADYPSFDESQRYDHDYIMVNSEEISRDDSASIKQMLMENGALTISYHTGGDAIYTSYYNRETKGQYGYDLTSTNHAVTLVGWDDTFSKDNFLTPAPGDGAWICKNSWGTTFGEDGYFYLSYYDPTFDRIYTLDMEENSRYDNRYQVYGIEWNLLKFTSGYTLLNMFTADSFETLTAASFYTSNASVPYKIYVTLDDEDGTPMSGELVYTQAGTADYAGYHTIDLNQTIPLKPGQKFTVAVTLDDSSGIFYLDMTDNTEGVSYFAGTTNPSSRTSWYAAGKNTSYLGEVCVSAFTEDNIRINAATFPDADFRSYISSSLDRNKDGELSEAEIAGVTSLSVSGKGIADLTGIEYFTYLTSLYCSSNQLKYVDLENNTRLTTLSCTGNSYSVGSVPCTGFTVDGLDMSRVTVISGGTISGEMFVPTAGASSITYQYACSSSQTATFKVSFTQTHAQIGSDGKCVNCGVQVYYAKAVSESGAVSYFTWLDKAITYAEEAGEPVTITLLAGMSGGFAVTKGDITFDGGSCSIVSWDEKPGILISGGDVTFTNSIIYNMSTGSALKVTGGTVSIQGGYYEEGEDETGIGLEVAGGTVTITGGNFRKYGTGGTAIKSSVPISDLLPNGYVFYANGSTTEISAEGYINSDETVIKTLSVSVTAGAHTSHEYNSGTTAGSSKHTAVCDQCGLTESQVHDFSAWTETDDTNHSKICSICGQKLNGTHTYGAWSVTDPDKHIKTCTACGHKAEGAHTFSAWADAGEDGCTRTCSVCGRVETQGHDLSLWFDMEDGETHARICTVCPYYEEAAHTPGECSDNGDGSHSSFCTVCDAEFSGDHTYGDWSDNGNGTHTRTCSDCGAEDTADCAYTEYEQDYDKITTHKEICTGCGASRDAEHVYTQWEDAEDDTYHVRICQECLWVDIQVHTLGDWSDNEDGTHTAGCTECTYSETHDHGFGDWTESDEKLHIRTCTDCGAEETAAHDYGSWTSDGADTHSRTCGICNYNHPEDHKTSSWAESSEENVHQRYCTVCGETESSGHTYGNWTDNGDGTHIRTCTDCGAEDTAEHILSDWMDVPSDGVHLRYCEECGYFESAEHTYGDWSDNGNGTHTRTCSDCGAEDTADCAYTEYEQDYDKKTTHKEICADCGAFRDAEHVYSEWIDAEDGGNHTRICLECAWMDYQNHALGDWSDNEDGTHTAGCTECTYSETHDHGFGAWTESGEEKHTRTCTDCGAEETAAHQLSQWMDMNDGTHARSCENCGYTEEGEHKHDDWTASDDTSHVHTCTVCGGQELKPHNFSSWTEEGTGHSRSCTDCGKTVTGAHDYSEEGTSANSEAHTVICSVCDAEKLVGHTLTDWADAGNGTHTRSCEHCDYEISSAHSCGKWTENGTGHSRSCTYCGKTETEEHDYSEEGTSANSEAHTVICSVCDAEKLVGHTLTDWADAGNGTHTRSCEHCGYQTSAAHSYSKWTMAGAEEGSHARSCTVCGREESEAHELSDWTNCGDYHERVCADCEYGVGADHTLGEGTDGGDGTHTQSCTTCTYAKREAHTFSDWEGDKSGHTHSCTVCGREERTSHDYSQWKDNGNNINHSRTCADCGYEDTVMHSYSDWEDMGDGTHGRTCTGCGAETRYDHSFGSWSDNGDGTHGRTCPRCQATERVSHDFGEWADLGNGSHIRACEACSAEETGSHIGSVCVNNGDGTHNTTCIQCGGVTSGTHNFEEYVKADAASHYQICADCGASVKAAHVYGSWTKNANGTYSRSCTQCSHRATYTMGDVTRDGVVNVFDLAMLKNGINNGFSDEYARTAADVNRDGKVDAKDASRLQRYLVGKVKAL